MAQNVKVIKPKDPETGQPMYFEALTETVFDKNRKKLSQIISEHEASIGNKVNKEEGKSLIDDEEIKRLARVVEQVQFDEIISEVVTINMQTTTEDGILCYYRPGNIFVWKVGFLGSGNSAVYFHKKEGNPYTGNPPMHGGIYACGESVYLATEDKLLKLSYANVGGESDEVAITQGAATKMYNENKSLIENNFKELSNKHQVMSEDAYEALPEKKVDVIYMTYEE